MLPGKPGDPLAPGSPGGPGGPGIALQGPKKNTVFRATSWLYVMVLTDMFVIFVCCPAWIVFQNMTLS